MYASVCCFGDYDWWSSGLEADGGLMGKRRSMYHVQSRHCYGGVLQAYALRDRPGVYTLRASCVVLAHNEQVVVVRGGLGAWI